MKIKLFLAVCLLGFYVSPFKVTAQQNKPATKKVIIIQKTDDNGKVTESRKEVEGDAAEELLKSMSPEVIDSVKIENKKTNKKTYIISKKPKYINTSKEKDGEKTIEITSEFKDGKRSEKYKVITKDSTGEKVLEWDGMGKMPETLKNEMGHFNVNKIFDGEKMEINVDIEKGRKGNKMMMARNGKKVKNRNDDIWPRRSNPSKNYGETDSFSPRTAEKPNNNKVALGVMIKNTDNGVEITDLVSSSTAEVAGLRRGDVLLKINDKYIFTTNGLMDALNPFNPNEKIKLGYIREGKEKSVTATLKART